MPNPTRRFNLIEEPWIEILDPQGQPRTVGIKDALLNADHYLGVADPDPGIEAAVHRLLFAVTRAALPKMRNAPDALPVDTIAAYLDTHIDQFWLIHPDRPFLQHPHLNGVVKAKSPTGLGAPFWPGEGSKVYKDGFPRHDDGMSFPEAARRLLGLQAWGSGQKTGLANPFTKDTGSTPAGPLAGSVTVIPKGATLADTILFNWNEVADPGVPVWESETGVAPTGWLGRLVFPSRSYLLESEDGEQVTGLMLGSGWKVEPPTPEREPSFIFQAAKDDSEATYVRGPGHGGSRFIPKLPVLYGAEGLGAGVLSTALLYASEQGKKVVRATLYGRDNVAMNAATRQLRLDVPLSATLLSRNGRKTYAGTALTNIIESTRQAANVLGSATFSATERRHRTAPGMNDRAATRAAMVWAYVEPLIDNLLQDLAEADTDNRVDELIADYRAEVRSYLFTAFATCAAGWNAIDYATGLSQLVNGIAKHFPKTTTKEQVDEQ